METPFTIAPFRPARNSGLEANSATPPIQTRVGKHEGSDGVRIVQIQLGNSQVLQNAVTGHRHDFGIGMAQERLTFGFTVDFQFRVGMGLEALDEQIDWVRCL